MFRMDSSDDEDGGDDDGGQESPQEGFAAAVVVEPVEPEPLEGAPTQEQGDGAGSETEDDTDDEEAQVAQLAAHVAPALAAQPANGDDQHEGAMPQPEDLQQHLGDATQPPSIMIKERLMQVENYYLAAGLFLTEDLG